MGSERRQVEITDFLRVGKRLFRHGDVMEVYDMSDARRIWPRRQRRNCDDQLSQIFTQRIDRYSRSRSSSRWLCTERSRVAHDSISTIIFSEVKGFIGLVDDVGRILFGVNSRPTNTDTELVQPWKCGCFNL